VGSGEEAVPPVETIFVFLNIKMVTFYAFPVIFIDTVLFKKAALIKRTGVRTSWTPAGSVPDDMSA